MISGVDRAAARLVRLVQSGGSNGSLRFWGNACLSRALSLASLAFPERGAKMCTLRHHVDLQYFLMALTKLGKMNPTLSILVLARKFTLRHEYTM